MYEIRSYLSRGILDRLCHRPVHHRLNVLSGLHTHVFHTLLGLSQVVLELIFRVFQCLDVFKDVGDVTGWYIGLLVLFDRDALGHVQVVCVLNSQRL
jgi:hypothetical protein